jgi:uncharacterized protein (DUF2164 family)
MGVGMLGDAIKYAINDVVISLEVDIQQCSDAIEESELGIKEYVHGIHAHLYRIEDKLEDLRQRVSALEDGRD